MDALDQHIQLIKRLMAVCLLTLLAAGSLTSHLTAATGPPLVIRGASVFDPVQGEMLSPRTVWIEQGRITRVRTGSRSLPKGAQVIEGHGKFVIPGLIDAHAHVVHILNSAGMTGEEVLPIYLAHGITSLRDVGDELVAQKRVADYAETHPDRGPRLFLGSPLIDRSPPYHSVISRSVDDPSQVEPFVEEMVHRGVQTFKIYVGIDRLIGRRVIQQAHRHRKWVTGHLGRYPAQDAVEDGIDSLEHIASVFEFILPPDLPSLPPADLRAGISAEVRQRILLQHREGRAHLDLTHPRVTKLISRIKAQNVMVDPTLVVYRNWMLLNDAPEILRQADLAVVPEPLKEAWNKSLRETGRRTGPLELRRQEFGKLQELTGLLHRAGVRLMAGTDAPVALCPPGASLHQELELLVASGLSPVAALQSATLHNAQALRQEKEIGRVEPGMLADLVILHDNPLVDIRNSRKIYKVIRSGHVCEPEKLLQSVLLKGNQQARMPAGLEAKGRVRATAEC